MADDKLPPTYRFTAVTTAGQIRTYSLTLDEATKKFEASGVNPVLAMAKEWLAAINSKSFKTVALSFDIGDGGK